MPTLAVLVLSVDLEEAAQRLLDFGCLHILFVSLHQCLDTRDAVALPGSMLAAEADGYCVAAQR